MTDVPAVLFVCVNNNGKVERMRLIRDDIAARVAELDTRLTGNPSAQ